MFTKPRLFVLISVLMLVALVAAACPAPATEAPAAPAATQAPAEQAPAAPAEGDAKTEVKPAFVYVAPVGDMGWTWAHDQARQMVEKELGVTTTFVENVPEGPDAERVIRDLAQKGFNPIFTTSFGFMDATEMVADSLKAFEEGIRLIRFCTRKIDEVERKVEILLRDEEDRPIVVPFPPED